MAPMGPFCKPRVFTRGYDCVCKITEKFFVESAAGGMLDRTIASAYIESVIDGKGRMGGV